MRGSGWRASPGNPGGWPHSRASRGSRGVAGDPACWPSREGGSSMSRWEMPAPRPRWWRPGSEPSPRLPTAGGSPSSPWRAAGTQSGSWARAPAAGSGRRWRSLPGGGAAGPGGRVPPPSLGRPTPRLEVSPGARFLAYVVPPPPGGDGGQSVAVQRQDGTGRRILGPPGRILGLAWSPSGTVLALARRRGQDRASLELVDVTTGLGAPVGEYRPETSPTAGPVSLAWAPSGRALAVGPGPGQPPDPVWVVLLRRR